MRTSHHHQALAFATTAFLALTLQSRAHAAVTGISPFSGQYTDTFDQYSSVNALQSLAVCDGLGTLTNLTVGGAIKLEFGSTFQGYHVAPLSGMMCGQLGVAQWTFTQPVSDFGAWFENNSGQDNATVRFFDAQNVMVGQVIAGIPFAEGWTWNGWHSDVPFTRMVVSGNGVGNGFLWYENVQVNAAIPAPGCLTVLALAAATSRRRRRLGL